MGSGMGVAEIPDVSDTLLMPFDGTQAEMKFIGTENCVNVVPLLASRSASVLPSRPTCPRIHWALTGFDEKTVARTGAACDVRLSVCVSILLLVCLLLHVYVCLLRVRMSVTRAVTSRMVHTAWRSVPKQHTQTRKAAVSRAMSTAWVAAPVLMTASVKAPASSVMLFSTTLLVLSASIDTATVPITSLQDTNAMMKPVNVTR